MTIGSSATLEGCREQQKRDHSIDCDVSVTLYSDDLSKSQMTLPLVRYHCVMFSLSFSYDMFERILSLQGSTKKKS